MGTNILTILERFADAKPSEWDEWVNKTQEGGKKKVPNPNPDTRPGHPQVDFSTAIKNKEFYEDARKRFRAWKDEQEETSKEDSSSKDSPKDKQARIVTRYASQAPGDLITFTDEEGGMQSRVYLTPQGQFRTFLKDLDSGNTLPHMTTFPDYDRAVAHAKKILGAAPGAKVKVNVLRTV